MAEKCTYSWSGDSLLRKSESCETRVLVLDGNRNICPGIQKLIIDSLNNTDVVQTELAKECYRLSQTNWELMNLYPQLMRVAAEYKATKLRDLTPEEVARMFGRDNRIAFLKEMRARFEPMDLLTAKCMQEGFWKRFGWE